MKSEQDEQSIALMQAYEQAEYLPQGSSEGTRSSGKQGLNFRPMWRLIRRNLLLIGGINFLVAGVVVYLVLSRPLTYEGEFQLLVEPVTETGKLTDPAAIARPNAPPDEAGLDYSTLIRVLKSPKVLTKIVDQISTKYPLSYNDLIKDMKVERIGQEEFDKTKLIRVGFEDKDTEKILFILKQLSDGYLKYSLEDRKTRLGSGVAFIEQQLPEIRQRVSTLENQLQALQQKHRISDLTTEGVELAKQSRELESQRSETQRNLRAEKDKFANLQKQLGLSPNQVIAASSLSENPRYQQLLTQLKQVETNLAQERSRLTEENPIIEDLQAQQRNLAALLSQETKSIVSQSPGSGPGATQLPKFQTAIQRNLSQQMIDSLNEIQVLEVRSQAAVQAATQVEQQLRQFPAIKRSYDQIERQLEIDTTTLKQLLQQRESLRVEAAQREIPWQLVSGPQLRLDDKGRLVLPEQSRAQKIALGLLGGFLLGLGAALLKEKRQDIFHGDEDLQDQTKLSLLGAIPYNPALANAEGDALGSELPMGDEQNAVFLQACEALYTKIRFLSTDPAVNAIVVSSVSAQDGKTTIALYLAQAAARMGQRVLLVDANLPFPQLHVRLGLPNFQGLSEILGQNLDPNQLIQRVPYQKIFLF